MKRLRLRRSLKIEHLLLANGFSLISSKVALEKEIKAESLPGENNPAKEKSRDERIRAASLSM